MRTKGPAFSKVWFSCLACLIVWHFGLTSSLAGPLSNDGISGGGWAAKLSGDLGYKLGPVGLGSDLDLSKTRIAPRAWAEASLPIPLFPSIQAGMTVMEYSGSSSVKNLGFGDYLFEGSISSRLKLNQYDLLIYYHVPFIQDISGDVIDLRLGMAARYFDGYIRVRGPSEGRLVTEKKNLSFMIPMAYLGATVSLPVLPFSIHADARGLSYDGSYYYDLEGKISARILNIPVIGTLFVSGGYKWEQVRLKPGSPEDDLDTKSTVQGIFIELGIRF